MKKYFWGILLTAIILSATAVHAATTVPLGKNGVNEYLLYTADKLGIGTASPSEKLSVENGAIYVSSSTNVMVGNGNSLTSTATGVILGTGNTVSGPTDNVALGNDNSVASSFLGFLGESIAVGNGNTINSNAYTSGAFGQGNTINPGSASGINYAFGYGNTVTGGSAYAIGNQMTNSVTNSLMIGLSDTAKMTVLGSNGNVGIGTTSPAQKLTVAGDISGNIIYASNFVATSSLATSTFAGGLESTVAVGPGLRVDRTTGRVRIGNGSPNENTSPLSVEVSTGTEVRLGMFNTTGATQRSEFTWSNSAGSNSWTTNFCSGMAHGGSYAGANYWGTAVADAGMAAIICQGTSITSMTIGMFNNIPIIFGNSNTVRMQIAAGGNVAIGGTSSALPTATSLFNVGNTAQFQVTSTGQVLGPVLSANTPSYSFVGDANTGMRTPTSGSDIIHFTTSAADRMTITATGNVGIGTTTPGWGFQVASSTGPQLALSDRTLNGDHFVFRNAGNGGVGNALTIATSSPVTYATTSLSNIFTLNRNGSLCIGGGCTPMSVSGLFIRDQEGTGPTLFMGGNDGGDTDWQLRRFADNDSVSDDRLSFGTGNATSTPSEFVTFDSTGKTGFASTSPYGLVSVEMGTTNPTLVVQNQGSSSPAFIIGGTSQNGKIGFGGIPSAQVQYVLADDTDPPTITVWDQRHVQWGTGGAQAPGLGMSYSSGDGTVNMSFLEPNVAWRNARFNFGTMAMYSQGTTLGLTQDATGLVGIGTVSPSYTLDVVGAIHSSTYYASDGTEGYTGTCTILGLTSIEVKNGLVTNCS